MKANFYKLVKKGNGNCFGTSISLGFVSFDINKGCVVSESQLTTR